MRKRSSYFTELSWLLFIKRIGKLIPQRLRFRFYKLLYNYESPRYKGVQLIIPYFESLNLQFIVSTQYLIDWNVFFFGQYEKETNDLLLEYIKPGQVVIEAGANNGTETVLLSRLVGPTGKVFAFEPVEHIHNMLQLNLSINHCGNVTAEQKALGESDGELYFNVLPENFCNQGMAGKYDERSVDTKVLVQQTSIDSLLLQHHIQAIDFIKMDIQGAEIELLKGAEQTIQKSKPLIFTEATEDFLSIQKLFETLSDLNYSVYFIQPKGHLRLLSKDTLIEGNWLAKPTPSI
ncbi:MAG: FkbM family methyltransferase [Chitinophagaceae bacterium]|nr:FkbM family methyltransferase [Chitinophagaceae bacterium]